MGYTHSWRYWTGSAAYERVWPQFVADTEPILSALAATGLQLAGPMGTHAPLVDVDRGIAFNASAAAGEDYEAMLLEPPGPDRDVWAFCKTQHRPYDIAVTSVLLRLYLLAPQDFCIGPDGSWPDWKPARDLIGDLFDAVPGEESPLGDTALGLTWKAPQA